MPTAHPNDPNRMNTGPRVADRSWWMGTPGILAALAVAVVLGLIFFNMGDKDIASNVSPGVTTGSSSVPATSSSGTSNSPAPTGTPTTPATR